MEHKNNMKSNNTEISIFMNEVLLMSITLWKQLQSIIGKHYGKKIKQIKILL